MIKKKNIRAFDAEQLTAAVVEMGEKSFRAKQLWDWLWKKNVGSFEEMLNLSKSFREKLQETYAIDKVSIDSEQVSSDGTVKFGMRLADGNLVEGVLIPTPNRITACVSSQAGCSLSCKFCATGYLDLKKNLLFYEIYDQVDIIAKEAQARFGRPLTNIVYMGMGEPLLNYKNVLTSIERITSPESMHMSPRRITVSTAGISKLIKRLGDDGVKFEFAVSLHAANDEKRSEIMPINEHNSLEALKEALEYFYEKTGTRVTYEYIVFHDFNDGIEDAKELLEFSRHIPSKINIIEYNPIAEAGYKNTGKDKLERFKDYLEARGAIVNLRRSRGKDVDGACGQLALKKRETA